MPRMGDKALKIVLSFCFLAVIVSLIGIKLSPARGYELSIYSSIPLFVWILLILSSAIGIGIIVYQAFARNKSNWWLAGFFLIILVNFIILVLPALRGYYYYNGSDPFMHLEFVSYIISSSHFVPGDLYPIIHILLVELADICAIPPVVAARYLPALFSVLGMIYTYLLARVIMPQKGRALLVAAATATLLYGSVQASLYPHAIAIMSLPLVFYLYFRIQQKPQASFQIPFLLLLIMYPFLYPPASLVIIVCLIAAELAKVILAIRKEAGHFSEAVRQLSLNPILISFIVFFFWLSNSLVFGSNLRHIVGTLRGEAPQIPNIAVAEASLQAPGTGAFVEYIFKMYGDILLYGILAFIAAIIIIRKVVSRESTVSSLFSLLLISAIAGLLHLFLAITSPSVSIGRLLNMNFMVWAFPLLATFTLYGLFKKSAVIARYIVVTFILVLCSIVGILGVYHSPYILGASWQVTYRDMAGTEWFVVHNQPTVVTHVLGYDFRSAAGALGLHKAGVGSAGLYSLSKLPPEADIPEHFDYPDTQKVGGLFTEEAYLIINQRFRTAGMEPELSEKMVSPPIMARIGFNEEDFARLEVDSSVDMVYTNGGLEVRQVSSD